MHHIHKVFYFCKTHIVALNAFFHKETAVYFDSTPKPTGLSQEEAMAAYTGVGPVQDVGEPHFSRCFAQTPYYILHFSKQFITSNYKNVINIQCRTFNSIHLWVFWIFMYSYIKSCPVYWDLYQVVNIMYYHTPNI